MKLKTKNKDEIIGMLVEKVAELEESVRGMVVVISERDMEIEKIKAELAAAEEKAAAKLIERDKIIRSQAETMKALAVSLKEGSFVKKRSERSDFTQKDLRYLAKIIKENDMANTKTKPKTGIIEKFFKGAA